MDLFMKASIPHHLHPLFEACHIVDALGLDEVNPCGGLLGQPDGPEFKGVAKGILRCPDEELDLSLNLLFSPEERPLIPHRSNTINQLEGIQIVNILRVNLVSKGVMVSGEAEHV